MCLNIFRGRGIGLMVLNYVYMTAQMPHPFCFWSQRVTDLGAIGKLGGYIGLCNNKSGFGGRGAADLRDADRGCIPGGIVPAVQGWPTGILKTAFGLEPRLNARRAAPPWAANE